MKFQTIDDLKINGCPYASVGDRAGVIHIGEGDEMQTFTVSEAKQLRDWLTAALPVETEAERTFSAIGEHQQKPCPCKGHPYHCFHHPFDCGCTDPERAMSCEHDWVDVDAYPFREKKCTKCGATVSYGKQSDRAGKQ